MNQIFFHIDVNSAFLSWSAVDLLQAGSSLDIRTVPSIIGGNEKSRHGIILAASIPAKKLGIKTGEPLAVALKKCPHLIIEPPNYPLYEKSSRALMDFLQNFTPDIEPLSIDECFIDYTPISSFYPSTFDGANQIRQAILDTLGFTVNIGISDKKVLAKMASDFEKPNKVHTLYKEEIKTKMWPLSISDLYMCGKSSQNTLKKLGLFTIGDIATSNVNILEYHLKKHGKLLWEYANGIDDNIVTSSPIKRKGVGNSITLAKDATNKEEVFQTFLLLADSVGERLRFEHDLTTLIAIEIKYNTFETVSHQTTLTTPTNSTQEIYTTACSLFCSLWNGTPIRLLGIRTSKLISDDTPVQLDLFSLLAPKESKKQENLDKTLDCIRQKYGHNSIVRGSLLDCKNIPFKDKKNDA